MSKQHGCNGNDFGVNKPSKVKLAPIITIMNFATQLIKLVMVLFLE